MSETEKPNLQYVHAYAIVRIDLPLDEINPENSFAIVKVFLSHESAQREKSRLSDLNKDKNCNYIVYTSRLIPAVP